MKYTHVLMGMPKPYIMPELVGKSVPTLGSSKKPLNPYLILCIGIGIGLYMGYIIGSNFPKFKVNPQS